MESQLEQSGRLVGILTQNVDGLHSVAGSVRVVELHGSAHWVGCLSCHARTSRARLQVCVCDDDDCDDCDDCDGGLNDVDRDVHAMMHFK
jgi:NAD-dependent deacetylase